MKESQKWQKEIPSIYLLKVYSTKNRETERITFNSFIKRFMN